MSIQLRLSDWRGHILSLALGLGAITTSYAKEPLVTDRPGMLDSSMSVGEGVFQVETSVTNELNKSNGLLTRTYTAPTLFKYGISKNVELRLSSNIYTQLHTSDTQQNTSSNVSGFNDFGIGFKHHFLDFDAKTFTPSLSWIAQIDMPGGQKVFRTEEFRPSLRMVAEWNLPFDYSIGLMPGVSNPVNANGDRYVSTFLGASLSKSFTPALKGLFVLAGREFTSKENGGDKLAVDTALIYLINPDTQLDLSYSAGLNKNTPDHAWGLGLSIRF